MYGNANYSFNPWMKDMGILAKPPTFLDNQDQLRFEALLSEMSMTSDEIRLIRPTVGNTPFPPRFGYEKREPRIEDVLSIGYPTALRDTPTRQDSGMQGSSRDSYQA